MEASQCFRWKNFHFPCLKPTPGEIIIWLEFAEQEKMKMWKNTQTSGDSGYPWYIPPAGVEGLGYDCQER